MLVLYDVSGNFPLGDGLDLVGLDLDAFGGDNKSTEGNPRHCKEAFGLLGVDFFPRGVW